MKTFRQYISEEKAQKVGGHHWLPPKHTDEHDEVHHQAAALKDDPHTPNHVKKQLAHLADKKNYVSAMKSATSTNIHHTDKDLHKIGNTDAADKRGISGNPDIEKAKHDRVSNQFKDSKKNGTPMSKPIIIHDTHTNHKHLLAGNTRLSHGVQDAKAQVPVHTIKYNSSEQK